MKTILITGSTDGIGLKTAHVLKNLGHKVLLHGRTASKLERAQQELGGAEGFLADLSSMADVVELADAVTARGGLDVLINNAGVLKAPVLQTADGLDVRFVVNTIAPYLLTKRLMPLLGEHGRVVNLASAAQAPVNLSALTGPVQMTDFAAYSQSKLAIMLWTAHLADDFAGVMTSVNPGSMLGSKMVKEAFGVAGGSLDVGAQILRRAALDDDFGRPSGRYYDNDNKRFSSVPGVGDAAHRSALVATMDKWLASVGF